MSRRNWLLFVAMCLIWGIPYLLIRVAVRDIPPVSLVFARTGIAALILVPIAVRRHVLRPALRRWRPLLAFTAVELAIPWLLLSDAETKLSSSLTGLLIALVPIIGVLLARMVGEPEPLDAPRLVGLLIGIGGVAALVGLDFGQLDGVGLIEVVLVAVGYALGPLILSRHLRDAPSVGVVAASLLIAALAYAPLAALDPPHRIPGGAAASVLVLAIVCTALAFVLFFALIAGIGPARATVITYVNPAVAVLLGVTVLGERFTTGLAIGFPLILIGSVLAARRRTATAQPEAESLASASPVSRYGSQVSSASRPSVS
jgi:drug/metabolite transporter (DMT)-like permease